VRMKRWEQNKHPATTQHQTQKMKLVTKIRDLVEGGEEGKRGRFSNG